MHVWWRSAGADGLDQVGATLEVIEPPTVARLHFWALQATFADDRGRPVGTAHLGLQWHPRHPGSTAVNWGGYRPDGRGELAGATVSDLPSATDNPNTRDFPWQPQTRYRLTITPDGTGAVTDETTGTTTVVRRLHLPEPATRLRDPVVWSEVFAECDDPSSAVRWSALTPTPTEVHLTYQSFDDGGCTNTDTSYDPTITTAVQRTNTERRTPAGRVA
jgi:hypothetical protein